LVFFGTASTAFPVSMAYQKNAFAFATADLIMPKDVHFAAREVLDGISMRIVQYDIINDKFPCRIDVLYGFKTIRPQLACRIAWRLINRGGLMALPIFPFISRKESHHGC
jgi:hypothetical protein